jgi:glutamate mutase epsilon subunit
VVVRWSDFKGETDDGDVVIPEALRVNYQRGQDGGCANTTVRADEVGLLQITNHPRETEQGALLPCRGS